MEQKINPEENRELLKQMLEKMSHVPAPPDDAAELWNRLDIDLYYGSGGMLKPSASMLAKRKEALVPPAPSATAAGPSTSAAAFTDSPSTQAGHEAFQPSAEDLSTARAAASKKNYDTPWLSIPMGQTFPEAKVRVFLFGHVGSAPSFFTPMVKEIMKNPVIEALTVQPPGRGSRARETPLRNCAQTAEELVAAVPWLFNQKPFIMFGHSYGSALMYHTAITLQRKGMRMPSHMIISSRPPIDWVYEKPYHKMTDAGIIEFMKDGTPAAILADKGMMAIMMPLIRADYEANETCVPEAPPVLPVPFTLCTGGPTDKTTVDPPMSETTPGWARFTSCGEPAHHDLSGGHYWVNQSPGKEWLVDTIQQTAMGAVR